MTRVCGAPKQTGFCGRPASCFQVLYVKGQTKPGRRYLCESCARRMRELHPRIVIRAIEQPKPALPSSAIPA
jgi:hypothetical protein